MVEVVVELVSKLWACCCRFCFLFSFCCLSLKYPIGRCFSSQIGLSRIFCLFCRCFCRCFCLCFTILPMLIILLLFFLYMSSILVSFGLVNHLKFQQKPTNGGNAAVGKRFDRPHKSMMRKGILLTNMMSMAMVRRWCTSQIGRGTGSTWQSTWGSVERLVLPLRAIHNSRQIILKQLFSWTISF